MKKLTVLLATLFFFLSGHTQIVSGLYSGSMYNDSTKMQQKYELALSEYRGKVMGYAYVTFIVNDTFYYGIRRVKGFKNEKNELVLTDEELLANNFPESPAKRVKRTATFPLNPQEDTVSSLKGNWETNATRRFYSVGGATATQRDADSSKSALITHLKELKVISDKPNYQDDAVAKTKPKKEEKARKDADKTAIASTGSDTKKSDMAGTGAQGNPAGTSKIDATDAPGSKENTTAKTEPTRKRDRDKNAEKTGNTFGSNQSTPAGTEMAKNNSGVTNPVSSNTNSAEKKTETAATNNVSKPVQNQPTQGSATDSDRAKVVSTTLKNETTKPVEAVRKEEAPKNTAKSEPVAQQAVAGTTEGAKPNNTNNNKPTDVAKTTEAAKGVDAEKKTTTTAKPEEKPAAVAAVSPVEVRKSTLIQTLDVVNDSIRLTFYDNGVVDGDVISVFVNGENIISSAKLNEVAIKKTIYLDKVAGETVQVTLVAETLGSIPPNTGLLLVYDGDKRYDVRFSADLQTNASIIFRKQKK